MKLPLETEDKVAAAFLAVLGSVLAVAIIGLVVAVVGDLGWVAIPAAVVMVFTARTLYRWITAWMETV